jgi:hypothetical protein
MHLGYLHPENKRKPAAKPAKRRRADLQKLLLQNDFLAACAPAKPFFKEAEVVTSPIRVVNTKLPGVIQVTLREYRWYLKALSESTKEITYDAFASVNWILSCFPKPGLQYWKERTPPEQQLEIIEASRVRGSRVHHGMEALLRGETVKPDTVYAWLDNTAFNYDEMVALAQMHKFLVAFKPIVEATEMAVLSPLGYGGTADLICQVDEGATKSFTDIRDLWKLKPNGKHVRAIVDWKSGSGIHDEACLQVASYAAVVPDVRFGIIVRSGAANSEGLQIKVIDFKDKSSALYYQTFLHTMRGPFNFLYGHLKPSYVTFPKELRY